jgi:hypothetical protein
LQKEKMDDITELQLNEALFLISNFVMATSVVFGIANF